MLAGVQADFQLPEDLIQPDHGVLIRFDGMDMDFPIPGMSDVMPYPSTVFSAMSLSEIKTYRELLRIKIKSAVERFKPDILHTHHLWVMSALARSLYPDLPMVTTCHGTCLRQHVLSPGISKTIRQVFPGINAVIALNLEQKQKMIDDLKMDSDRVQVIPGGFDKTHFFFAPKEDPQVVELVYAGKLSYAKGLPWLLKALKRIEHLPFRLHIAGSASGRERDDCLKLADRLKDKCIYRGVLTHPELGELLRRSHVFVLPSFYEGMPLVLMEALACGCRIVATRLPGVKEMFARHPADLVELIDLPELETIDQPFKTDEPMLEEKLARVLEKQIRYPLPVSPEHVRRVSDPFTWERIFAKVEKIYRSLNP